MGKQDENNEQDKGITEERGEEDGGRGRKRSRMRIRKRTIKRREEKE